VVYKHIVRLSHLFLKPQSVEQLGLAYKIEKEKHCGRMYVGTNDSGF